MTTHPEAMAGGPSLKARAIGYLSRREHSRRELERKLAPHTDDASELQTLLDQLAEQGWQSDERFAHSLLNRRLPRYGWQRLVHELGQHGIADHIVASLRDGARASEPERAQDVWNKRFGQRPETRKEYARQYRFMVSRGFDPDSVRRLLGELPADGGRESRSTM